jgi:putative NADPH-quinone reductase
MRILVVSSHPSGTSFLATARDAVLQDLNEYGHEVRHHDLYKESFNPVFSAFERLNHNAPIAVKTQMFPELISHIEDLQWCEALVLVYPTWWSAQPAMLKGWFDRVFVRDVAWELPEGAKRLKPKLKNIKKLVIVTTHGSSKFVNSVQGESGKRIILRSIRLMFHWRARTHWLAIYKIDGADTQSRKLAIEKLRRRVKRAL